MTLSDVETIGVEYCPICGTAERMLLFIGIDRLHGLPGSFPVVRCAGCGSSYLARRPVDLAVYYPADVYEAYDGGAAGRHSSRAPGRSYGLRRRRQLLERIKPHGGTLLDVGCGAGDFLAVMQARSGWSVSGLEPNAQAVQIARKVRDLDVRQGELPCSELPGAHYDIITMWHVLEHVPHPETVLGEVRRLLKPDGVLVLGLPVADSLEAKWFGPYWAGYDVPRHVLTFTRLSLSQAAKSAGFEVEEQTGVVEGFASLRLSLAFWLDARGGRWQRQRRLWVGLLLLPTFLYLRLRSREQRSVAVFTLQPSRTL